MTSPTSATSRHKTAFTLTEMLIVIAVIVVLVSLLVPMVIHSLGQAARMRAQADFQTISVGLEAYKQDFGDYPRLPINPATNQPYPNTGAATLGKALLGPYGDGLTPGEPPNWQASVIYNPGDCVGDGAGNYYVALAGNTGQSLTPGEYYAIFNPHDGADGPGFRVRTPGVGQVHSPYLAPGKIKNEGVFFIDNFGGPILYFPARPVRANLSPPGGAPAAGSSPYVDIPNPGSVVALFNANDNLEAFRREPSENGNNTPALNRIQIMFHDYNCNGIIDSTTASTTIPETPVTQPFVLISAGSDGIFGPANYTPSTTNPQANQDAVQNPKQCDDITNFQ